MCDGTAILKALCAGEVAIRSIDALAHKTGFPRKNVLRALGRLMQVKLATRCNPKELPALYAATKAGRDLIAAGKRVTSGPKKAHTGARKPQLTTFRARAWTVIRMKRKFTAPEVIELARNASDGGDLTANMRAFLKALIRAGIVAELKAREKGFALTSNGFKRYALIRDLGPTAPMIRADHLYDHNSRDCIPYSQRRAA